MCIYYTSNMCSSIAGYWQAQRGTPQSQWSYDEIDKESHRKQLQEGRLVSFSWGFFGNRLDFNSW